MSNFIIKIAENSDALSWDNYVLNHPDAGSYHLFGWKAAVEEVYGHKGYYLIAEDDSKIVGVLPLIFFKLPWGRSALISLPYCDYAGPLGKNFVCQALFKKSLKLASELRVSEIELRCPEKYPINSNNKPTNIASHKVRMLLTLPASSQELWGGFKSKLRSQIRKAKKNGLVFRWGKADSANDIKLFYYIFSRNMHALGSPVHSRRWIEAVLCNYGENARMGLVFKDAQPIGCGIILCTPSMVSIPWASTLREFNRLSPNMLLYWNFLKYAADSGRKFFDFGRSTPNEGTYRFKKQWGAEPKQLYWYRIGLNSREIDFNKQNTLKNNNKKTRKWAENCWHSLPLSVVNILGPKIRKYISL